MYFTFFKNCVQTKQSFFEKKNISFHNKMAVTFYFWQWNFDLVFFLLYKVWVNQHLFFLTEIFDFNKKILATAQMNTIYFEKMQLKPCNQSTCMQNMDFFYWEQVRLWNKFITFETDFKWQPFSSKPWVYHIFRFLFEVRPTPQGMIIFQKRMASLLDSLNSFNFLHF